MTISCGFFNSLNGDRLYSAAFLAEWLEALILSGVKNGGTNLQVSADGQSGLTVHVAPGKAWIKGYYVNNADAPVDAEVTPATGTTRWDRVVLKLDLSANERRIYAYVKQGTDAAPPELDRDLEAGVWELSLARVQVIPGTVNLRDFHVTDERLDSTVCGIANSRVEADTTNIFNTFYNYYLQKKAEFNADLAEMISDWNDFFGTDNATGERGEWYVWFNQVKADLGQVNVFDAFYNWARLPGFSYNTVFNANGNITETITNDGDGSAFAVKTTVFNVNGSITETISCPSVLSGDVRAVTAFNADGSITQAVNAL
jgi:hypothetical protein